MQLLGRYPGPLPVVWTLAHCPERLIHQPYGLGVKSALVRSQRVRSQAANILERAPEVVPLAARRDCSIAKTP
jgi:hypothetical protein